MATQHKSELVLTAKDKTRATLKGVEKNFGQLDGLVSKLGFGFASLAGATGIGAVITAQARGAKQTLAYADALGVSTEALSAWQFAGQSVGLESDKIADIMKDSAEKIGDAFRNNAGEAKDALNSLNLSIKDMAQLSPDKQLLKIAESLGQVSTQGEKVQILESLGNDASLLLPLLKDNGAELKRMIALSDETGKTLTRIEAEKLNEVNLATQELSAQFEGLTQELTTAAAPALVTVINLIRTSIPEAISFAQPAFEGIGKDILHLWEYLNPSEVTGTTSLEDALARQKKLADELSFAQHAGNDVAEARYKKQLDSQNLLVDSLQRQKKILEEMSSRKPINIPEPISVGDSVGGRDLSAADKAMAEKAKEQKARELERQAERLVELQAQQREALQNKFSLLDDSLKSEEQLIAESQIARQQIIQDAELAGIESIVPYNELRIQVAQEYEDKITALTLKNLSAREKFQKLSAKNQTKQVLGELINMTQGVAQHNKTMFNINKIAGIANATISTYEGVTKTLAAYPQPLAGILAATHLAAGLAQVSAIQSTSFGGGAGSAPSLAGSGGGSSTVNTVPVNPSSSQQSQPQGQQITINIAGSAIGDENVRQVIIEAVETAQSNDEIRILANG